MSFMSPNAGGEGSELTRQRGPRGGDPTPEVSSHCPHRCPQPRFRVPPPPLPFGGNTWMGQQGWGTVGRGCCLGKEVEQLKPARSQLESLFPERLFKRKKTSSKSQPRKPAIARGTGVGGQKGLQNNGPGEPHACAKPGRATAQGTFPGAHQGREASPLTLDVHA